MRGDESRRRVTTRGRCRRTRATVFDKALFADFEQYGVEAIAKMREESPVKYVQVIESALVRSQRAKAAQRRPAERAAAPPPAGEDEPVLSEAERERRAAHVEALRTGLGTEPGDES